MGSRRLLRGVVVGCAVAGAVAMAGAGAGAQPGSPPSAPVELRVTSAAPFRISFSWRNTATNAEWLYAYAPNDTRRPGGSPYRLLAPTATEVTLDPVGSETFQCLIVIAGNAAGYSAWSNWACAVTPNDQVAPPPARPRGPPGTLPPAAETSR